MAPRCPGTTGRSCDEWSLFFLRREDSIVIANGRVNDVRAFCVFGGASSLFEWRGSFK